MLTVIYLLTTKLIIMKFITNSSIKTLNKKLNLNQIKAIIYNAVIITILLAFFTSSTKAQNDLSNLFNTSNVTTTKIEIISTTQYDILNVNPISTIGLYEDLFSKESTNITSTYYEYDIIHISKVNSNINNNDIYAQEFKVECEGCLYPIGIFTISDIESLMYWITVYPPDEEVFKSQYHNRYYQDLIEEKIWE